MMWREVGGVPPPHEWQDRAVCLVCVLPVEPSVTDTWAPSTFARRVSRAAPEHGCANLSESLLSLSALLPRSEAAGSRGGSIFGLLKTRSHCFHSWRTILQSHQRSCFCWFFEREKRGCLFVMREKNPLFFSFSDFL